MKITSISPVIMIKIPFPTAEGWTSIDFTACLVFLALRPYSEHGRVCGPNEKQKQAKLGSTVAPSVFIKYSMICFCPTHTLDSNVIVELAL